MAWFMYKRGGWEIAVDAMNQRDASKFMSWKVPDAVSQGEFSPPTTTWSHMTAMVTPRRQEIISSKIRKEQGL